MHGTRGGRSNRGSVDTWHRPRLLPGGRIRDRLDNQTEAMHRIAPIALRGDRRERSPLADAAAEVRALRACLRDCPGDRNA